MSSLKIVLPKEKKADGLHPLAIRITKDRKSSFIYLGYRIAESDWDKAVQRIRKSHPNSVRLNNFLLKKLSEANDSALEIETKKSHVSAKAVRNKIKPTAGATFFPQAQSFLDALKASGKYNQYTSDKPRIRHFKEFLKGEDVAFTDLASGLLERFVVYLKSTHKPKRGKARIGERTIANHLVTIRSVFAHARKNGVVTKTQSPFAEGGIQIKFPDSIKIGLTPEEIKQLEDVELSDPAHHHSRNLWLVSFYFAGMRISDVFRMRWGDIQNNRLHYAMGKNNKVGSLKVPDKAAKIIAQYEQYRENKDDLIFPDLKGCDFNDKFKTQRTIAFKTSANDKSLRLHVAPKAGIDKKLTMHIARHSFAQNATNIDVRTLQMLFRHTKLETTEGYMGQFIHTQADDALDSVLAFEPPVRKII
jgi:integrase/recombinase XerD